VLRHIVSHLQDEFQWIRSARTQKNSHGGAGYSSFILYLTMIDINKYTNINFQREFEPPKAKTPPVYTIHAWIKCIIVFHFLKCTIYVDQ